MALQAIQKGINTAAQVVALPIIGASVWWAMRSVDIATFSPIGVGLGLGAYAIVKNLAIPFFDKIFNTNPSDKCSIPRDTIAKKRDYAALAVQLTSLTAAFIPIYYIGVLTLSTFNPIIETLLFIKGVEFLSDRVPDFIDDILGPDYE